jgi:signal transduction histidine kinase
MKQRLYRRLLVAYVLIALGVSAVFGLFGWGLEFTIEQHFFESLLSDEAGRLQALHAQTGRWAAPESRLVELHLDAGSLPPTVETALPRAPGLHELAPSSGRRYQALSVRGDGAAPWLLIDVSREYVLRPMRRLLAGWLLACAATAAGLSLALGWWMARRISAPLETLAARVTQTTPGQLPQTTLAHGLHDDEVGALARRFDALLARTHQFIAREQTFTRDASHELRTPLSVMAMTIQRLQEEPGLTPAWRHQLATLQAAADWMTQTVDSLLLLAREGSPQPCEPERLLPLVERWVLAHAGWLDEQALTLDLHLLRDDALRLPRPVLQIVLASLLGNAHSHGLAGGHVRVALEGGCLRVCNPSTELPADVGTAYVKWQASTGLGLGLAIVAQLLQRHGGELQIEHADGWTCARVTGTPVPSP